MRHWEKMVPTFKMFENDLWYFRFATSTMKAAIFKYSRSNMWNSSVLLHLHVCEEGKKTKMFFDLLNFKISFVYGNTIFRKPAMKCVYSSLKCTELRYVEVRFSFLCRLLFRITKEVVCYFRYFQSCLKRFPT